MKNRMLNKIITKISHMNCPKKAYTLRKDLFSNQLFQLVHSIRPTKVLIFNHANMLLFI